METFNTCQIQTWKLEILWWILGSCYINDLDGCLEYNGQWNFVKYISFFFSLPNFPLFREEMIRLDGSNYESAHKHIDIVGCLKFPFCI